MYNLFFYKNILNNSPRMWEVFFQNPSTPVMEGIIYLHNYIFMYLVLVIVIVSWFLVRSLLLFNSSVNYSSTDFSHDPLLESVWTIAPAFILIAIAIPSFSLLYSMDEVSDPYITVKAIGHQWYWSYEVDAIAVEPLLSHILLSAYDDGNDGRSIFPRISTVQKDSDPLLIGISKKFLEEGQKRKNVSNGKIKLFRCKNMSSKKGVNFLTIVFSDKFVSACKGSSYDYCSLEFKPVPEAIKFVKKYLKAVDAAQTIGQLSDAKVYYGITGIKFSIANQVIDMYIAALENTNIEEYDSFYDKLYLDIIEQVRLSYSQYLRDQIFEINPTESCKVSCRNFRQFKLDLFDTLNSYAKDRTDTYKKEAFTETIFDFRPLIYRAIEANYEEREKIFFYNVYNDFLHLDNCYNINFFETFAPVMFDIKSLSFIEWVSPSIYVDSYMLNDQNSNGKRLLETDNTLFLPTKTHIRLLVTSSDVIHSWSVPSFGIKVDAIPGRLNQTGLYIKRPGTFYGQCSELCGVNHGFMPIKIKAISLREFNELDFDIHKDDLQSIVSSKEWLIRQGNG